MDQNLTKLIPYTKPYKSHIIWNVIYNILYALFSTLSMITMFPLLEVLFKKSAAVIKEPTYTGIQDIGQYGKDWLFFTISDLNQKEGPQFALLLAVILVIATFLLKNLFNYLASYHITHLKNGVLRDLRQKMYYKIIDLPISYYSEKRKGDILSRASNDIAELESSVISALEGLIKEPLTIIGILIFLFLISAKLTLFVFILLPVAGFIVGRIGRSLKKHTNSAQVKWGEILSQMEETLSGLRIIKAFNAEGKVKGQFYGLVEDIFNLKNRILNRRDLASPVSEFLGVTILCGVLWFGGKLVLSGDILSPGSFITYVALFSQIINPAKALSQAIYNVNRGTATLDRLNEILEAPNTVEEVANPI